MKFQCPQCHQKLSAEKDWIGQTMPCPACSTALIIPHAATWPYFLAAIFYVLGAMAAISICVTELGSWESGSSPNVTAYKITVIGLESGLAVFFGWAAYYLFSRQSGARLVYALCALNALGTVVSGFIPVQTFFTAIMCAVLLGFTEKYAKTAAEQEQQRYVQPEPLNLARPLSFPFSFRRFIQSLACVFLIVSWLFPYSVEYSNSGHRLRDAGFTFLFTRQTRSVRVDFSRLFLTDLCILSLAGCSLYFLRKETASETTRIQPVPASPP